MLSVSDEFRKAVSENPNVLVKGRVDFPSGETLDLAPGDFIGEGAVFTHATSSAGSFDIGAADLRHRGRDPAQRRRPPRRVRLLEGDHHHVGRQGAVHRHEWLRKGKY